MSISAVSKFTGLHWKIVRNVEKAWLEKKYKRIRLDDAAYLGKRLGYIAVVHDIEVLNAGLLTVFA